MASIAKSLFFVATITILALSVFPVIAQVQPIIAPDCGFLGMNCTGGETFGGNFAPFMLTLINVALGLIGTISTAFIVIGGYLYVTSTGDEHKAERAKNQIIYAILGLVVAGGAFALVNTVTTVTSTPLVFYLVPYVLMALSLVSIIAAIYLVYAGYLYITSTGDEENSARAKRQIVYAMLGMFIASSALVIVNVIASRDATGLIVNIRSVVNTLLTILGVAAAVYIIIAGAMYITSTGDQDKSARAKMQIVYALIGIVVIILSAVAVNLIVRAV